jgi:hypothetical protein
MIGEAGGSAQVLRAETIEGEPELVAAFNTARVQEYAEIIAGQVGRGERGEVGVRGDDGELAGQQQRPERDPGDGTGRAGQRGEHDRGADGESDAHDGQQAGPRTGWPASDAAAACLVRGMPRYGMPKPRTNA